MEVFMMDAILEDHQVASLREAKEWFSEVYPETEFTQQTMPLYRTTVAEIDGDYEMYHAYGVGYYFLVRKGSI